MIGMMNSANMDQPPVEFYSAPKRSSLYDSTRRRETITYLDDGRTLLDGQPVVEQTPDQMWSDTILRVVCHSVCRNSIERGRKSKIRRFLGRLSLHNDNLRPVQKENTVKSSSLRGVNEAQYVTTIFIQNDEDPKQQTVESKER
ncbi:hypothetical protein M3Y96_01180800 [Aphelenchoides besseyi]|nr:hypothetical protein M3Y96_01180800 [Aphelenchoides besseyi]